MPQRANNLRGVRIPKANEFVAGSGHDSLAIRTEMRREHFVGVFEFSEQAA
jgi:hypothetical protein